MHPDAGDFVLTYNDITGRIRKVNWKLEQQYNEGHMLIFPSDLFHAVYPPHFLTDEKDYRYRVTSQFSVLTGINDQKLFPVIVRSFSKKVHKKRLYNITLWTNWFDRGILKNVITTCYGKRIYSKS